MCTSPSAMCTAYHPSDKLKHEPKNRGLRALNPAGLNFTSLLLFRSSGAAVLAARHHKLPCETCFAEFCSVLIFKVLSY